MSSRLLILPLWLVAGCVAQPEARDDIVYPTQWQRIEHVSKVQIGQKSQSWLQKINDPKLLELIDLAVEQNHSLRAQAARVEELRQSVIIANAGRLPSFTAGLTATRQEFESAGTSGISTAHQLTAEGSYEVDVWRRLSDIQQQSQLRYRAQQFAYEQARLTLYGNVARAWFAAIYAKQLTTLFNQRVDNINQNLEIIEAGYKQGLNSALDVYLTRNSVEQERARLASQQQNFLERAAALQTLVAEYPDGDIIVSEELPTANWDTVVGVPSEIVARRADLQESWTLLLAQHAGVAVAHKQRYPRIQLRAAIDHPNDTFSKVFEIDEALWSVLGSLSAPLWMGGQLRAQEKQSRQLLIQTEQNYLATVKNAFAEVENALSAQFHLQLQLKAVEQAEQNAAAAYELSFQQYQRGLVDYTTVLQAQQRAFDASFNLIDLRFQLINNYIDLNIALGGGEFLS